jgi:hypothetical protein
VISTDCDLGRGFALFLVSKPFLYAVLFAMLTSDDRNTDMTLLPFPHTILNVTHVS